MSRFHGRNGVIYLSLTSGGAAVPVAFLTDWTINKTSDKVEVTAFQDANKTYVAGLPDASGSFNGFYDDATPQMYAAANDGLPRTMYLYESSLSPTNYWAGQILPDMAVTGGVGAAVTVTSNWNAAGPVLRYRASTPG